MSATAVAETPTPETATDTSEIEVGVGGEFTNEAGEPTPISVEVPDAPGDKPVETDSAPAEQATEAEEFDATTLENASRLGLSAEVAKSFGSKEALQTALDATQLALDKQASAWARAQFEQVEHEHAQATKPAEQAQTQAQDSIEKYTVKLDPAEYDEAQIKEFNGIVDHYDAIARQHDSTLQQYKQHIELLAGELLALKNQAITGQSAEGPANITQDVDTFVASLGDEYADIYGKGDKTPDAKSLHFTARAKLAEEMEFLKYAEEKANRPRSSNQQLLQRALRVLHPDKIQQAARKEVEAKVAQRSKQAIARPSGHNGKAPSGKDSAVAFAAQFLRDNAVSDAELESAF